MTFNFNEVIERRNTGSYKWDLDGHQSTLAMWVADMDFKVADCITEAIAERAKHGIFGYATAQDSLYETIIERFDKLYDWKIKKNWITFLPGLETSFSLSSQCIHEDSAKVMYLSPIYPPFFTGPRAVGKSLHKLDVILKNDQWNIDFDEMEHVFKKDKNIKTLLFCNPHNPLGKLYNENELEELVELCVKYNILLVSDEIHCDLILNDKKHICVANLNESIRENSITLMGASKTYNIAGLGCGFAVIPNEKIRQSFKINMQGVSPMINPFGYLATEIAYKKAESWRIDLIKYLNINLKFLMNEIETMPGCKMIPPEASFLAWIDCRETGIDKPAKYFKSFGVDFNPGEQFGAPGFVRLNFGCPLSILKLGVSKMKTAIEQYKL